MTESEWKSQLAAGARVLGVTLSDAQLAQCWALANSLRERNQQVNLTAIDSLAGMLELHFLDSLTLVPHLGDAKRIVDIGTGAGFPGLPLAIACPEREFLLIDGTQKKIRFVDEMIATLGLANASAQAARAENLKPERKFDVVVVRAVGAIEQIVRVAGHLVGPKGRILAMKGRPPDDELAALPKGWTAEVAPMAVPGLEAARNLVSLRRKG